MDTGLLAWLEGSFGFYVMTAFVLVAYRRIIADALFQPKSELASEKLLPAIERLVAVMDKVLASNDAQKVNFEKNLTFFAETKAGVLAMVDILRDIRADTQAEFRASQRNRDR